MTKKNLTNIRARIDTKDKVNEMSRKLSMLEGRDVPVPEVLKRTFNIKGLPKVLEEDARAKKKMEGLT